MKKIIDIPDEIVKDLKILAIRDDKDLKNYLQDLISRHNEFSNITELASIAMNDGQSVRAIWNYLISTFEGLKNEKFSFDEEVFTDLTDFLNHVKMTCDWAIQSIENDIECNKDDSYEKRN